MIWFLIVLLILSLLFLLCLLKIKIKVAYSHIQDDDHLEIRFYAGSLKVYTYKASAIIIDKHSASITVKEKKKANFSQKPQKQAKKITLEKIQDKIHVMKELLTNIVGLHRIVKRLLAKTVIDQLKWKTIIGVGDAAHTAQIAGGVWALKGGMVGLLSRYFTLRSLPILKVQPHFQAMVSQISFSCMISFRVGHAIFAGLMLLKYWKHRKKRFHSHAVHETNSI